MYASRTRGSLISPTLSNNVRALDIIGNKNILPANKREKARKIRKDMRKKKRKDFFTILFPFFLFFASVRVYSRANILISNNV